jgi:hypothetical protein
MKMMQKTGEKVGEVVWVGEKRPWRFPDVPRLKLFMSFFFSTFCTGVNGRVGSVFK